MRNHAHTAHLQGCGCSTGLNEGSDHTLAQPIRQTVKPYPGLDAVMREIVRLGKEGVRDMDVRRMALHITRGIPTDKSGHPNRRDYDAIAHAIYDWMVAHIAYVRDPHGVEQVQSANVTLRLRVGDCDDMSVLAASLLGSLGVPAQFVIVGSKPGKYSHIYVEYTNLHGKTSPFDVTLATFAGDRPRMRHTSVQHHSLSGMSDGHVGLADDELSGNFWDLVDEYAPAAVIVGQMVRGKTFDEAVDAQQSVLQRAQSFIDSLRSGSAAPLTPHPEIPGGAGIPPAQAQAPSPGWLVPAVGGAVVIAGMVALYKMRR